MSACLLRTLRSRLGSKTCLSHYIKTTAVQCSNYFRVEPPVFRAQFSTSCVQAEKETFEEKTMVTKEKQEKKVSKEIFQDAKEKNRESFKNAIDLFTLRDHRRRGAVEFINAALKNMKQFGVHRDLEIYKSLIDVLPKGQYVPQNLVQADFWHYPKQQDCICSLLDQMDMNRVIPDEEVGKLLNAIFSIYSSPFKKYARMCYWMPKLKNVSPWPLPFEVPNDALELAKLAISKITSVDRLSQLTIYETEEITESIDKTWIVSGMSPLQKEIIEQLPKDKALYVEGGFRVWIREAQVTYFILRGEAPLAALHSKVASKADIDDVGDVKMWIYGEVGEEQDLIPRPNVHQQVDGTIIGCCATGTSTRDSLLSWVRFLQRDNPSLENIPILFTLHSPLGPVVPLSEDELKNNLTKTR